LEAEKSVEGKRLHHVIRSTARYGLAVVAVGTSVAVRQALGVWLGPGPPQFIIFAPAVMMTALLGGLGPALAASVLSATALALVIPPVSSFRISSPADAVGLVIFLAVSMVMSLLLSWYRKDREKAAAFDREAAVRATLNATVQRFYSILSNINAGILLISKDDKVEFVNDAFCAQFHLRETPDQLVGLSSTEVVSRISPVHVASPAAVVERVREIVRRGEPVRGEELPLPNGRTCLRDFIPLSLAGNPYGRLWVHFDITERKRIEEALRENEQRLRLAHEGLAEHAGRLEQKQKLLQAVMDGASNSHLVYLDCDFNFVRVNATYARTCGYTPEQMAGKNHFTLYPHPENRAIFARVRDTGQPVRFHDKPFVFPDQPARGITYWDWALTPVKDDAGKVTGLILSLYETTERKRAENALRRAEALVAQGVRVAGLGIFEHDHRLENFDCSPLLRQMLGFEEQEETTIARLLDKVEPQDQERLASRIQRAHQPSSDGLFDVEYRVHNREGRVRWVRARSQTFFEGEGPARHPVRTVGAVIDITQQKETQQELQRLVAERTSKLQELVGELEHFSYSITHDMRAPLRAMRGFSELLMDLGATCPQQEQNEFLRKIMVSADRMDALIRDALNYSKSVRQELPLEAVDTGELLRGMLDTYPELQPARAHIALEGVMPIVLANQAGMTQCFSNLLQNAVKFSQPGQIPQIRIWAEPRPTPHALLGAPSGRVRIWVEDKGIGIGEKMLPRVFDMFSRGHGNYEGTGIGLALVRKVVQRMGGNVGVESQEGKGSRFWLELELAR
jgi:PAS domain S-box-containing protein